MTRSLTSIRPARRALTRAHPRTRAPLRARAREGGGIHKIIRQLRPFPKPRHPRAIRPAIDKQLSIAELLPGGTEPRRWRFASIRRRLWVLGASPRMTIWEWTRLRPFQSPPARS